jgi:signal transduction histidine kinase
MITQLTQPASPENRSKKSGLRDRMWRLFAIQIAVISMATLVGIYLTQLIIEDLLTRQALNLEAEHFWARFEENSQHPLPDVANMQGYMASAAEPESIPAGLENLTPGFGRAVVDGRSLLVHVSDQAGKRLYLLFEVDRVSDLAFYLGVMPLSIVLLLMYIILFVVYRWSQRALSPIVRLANLLETVDFNASGRVELDLEPLRSETDDEVEAMISAVEHFTDRLNAAIERERIFTRDAGHELRTPVAVFKGSLDLMEQNSDRPDHDRQALARMRRTVEDMEALLETLLLLAREEELATPAEPVLVNDVVSAQLDNHRFLAERSCNQIKLREQAELRIRVPGKVLEIVLSNLIRNALTYTSKGEVTVTVTRNSVRVTDTGIGMNSTELANAFEPFFRAEPSRTVTKGHGLGLSIVRRLSRQFKWTLLTESQPNEGTSIEVQFPDEQLVA